MMQKMDNDHSNSLFNFVNFAFFRGHLFRVSSCSFVDESIEFLTGSRVMPA